MNPLIKHIKWFAQAANIKMLAAMFGLLLFNTLANGQACVQLKPQDYYSRVVNGPIYTGNFLQSDYDAVNQDIYVPATYNSPSTPTGEYYLTSVHNTGYINSLWGNRYSFTSTEQCMATKLTSTNGDIAMAGTTQGANGNRVLMVMMTKSNGTALWALYFELPHFLPGTDVNYRVLLTETNMSHDIVVAASSSSSDDHILVRLDHNGTLRYYDDHPIYTAGNTTAIHPYINGITSTFDDGYVIVGSSGHQNDYFAATVFKYDQNYVNPASHLVDWSYTYRHYLGAGYSPAPWSSTEAQGVMENPLSHNIIVVGYTGDHDASGLPSSTSYQNGFIMELDNAGSPLNLYNYAPPANFRASFNGVNMDLNNSGYIITGSLYDYNTGLSYTIITDIDNGTYNVNWANYYGTSANTGLYVYPKTSSPPGYLSFGLSDDQIPGTLQPHVLAVDANGAIPGGSCSTSVSLTQLTDVNDVVQVNIGSSTPYVPHANTFGGQNYDCQSMAHLCGPNCTQNASITPPYYSAAVTGNAINDFLKADIDVTNGKVYVPGSYTTNYGVSSDAYYSQVDIATSQIDASSHYKINANETTRAIKKAANGDLILAGTTLHYGNHVIYIMRTKPDGSLLWCHYYDQSTTDVTYYLVMTETQKSNDIVVAASSWTGSNNNILIRVKSSGTLIYYDEHPMLTASLTAEYYPFINAITPTSDDGYVIVGSSGHHFDFFAATVYKYDAFAIPALNWSYIYRRTSSTGYDLTNPLKRSSSEAQGVTEDPVSHNIIVVGYTSNHDAGGNNATFKDGLIITLTSGGVYVNTNIYISGNGYFYDFNDVMVDGTDYVITGAAFDPNSLVYRTLVAKFTIAFPYNCTWAYTYGHVATNKGYSIFKTSTGDYVSVGITHYIDPNFYTYGPGPVTWLYLSPGGPTIPHVITMNSSGTGNTCGTLVSMSTEITTNSPPTLNIGSSSSATDVSVSINQQDACAYMTDVCTSAKRGLSGEKDLDAKASENQVKLYPNPATNTLNVEVNGMHSATGYVVVEDMMGKRIMVEGINLIPGKNHYEVDISALSKGIYFVHIYDGLQTNYPVSKIEKY